MTEATKPALSFETTLSQYQEAINQDVAQYCAYLAEQAAASGQGVAKAQQVFCRQLLVGSDRLPGCLVMEGYAMMGGTNQAMIVQAARALEMLRVSLEGDTTQAALMGNYAAMMILANLDAPAQLRTNVISITNRTLHLYAQAQADNSDDAFSTVTVLNPLHVGMVLADADCHATDAITPFAHALGQAMLQNSRGQAKITQISSILQALRKNSRHWSSQGTSFLEALTTYLLTPNK